MVSLGADDGATIGVRVGDSRLGSIDGSSGAMVGANAMASMTSVESVLLCGTMSETDAVAVGYNEPRTLEIASPSRFRPIVSKSKTLDSSSSKYKSSKRI